MDDLNIIDDYGWCRGARQASDEFFGSQPFKMMHAVRDEPMIEMHQLVQR
jgi:hypothetical protein